MKKIEYKGWPNCYLLSNGIIKLIVTTDVGPRIINLSFEEGENLFKEFPEMLGKTGSDIWRIYGGHRLWHAPEEKPRTYFPDNYPVGIEVKPGVTRLVQKTESTTGVQKEIELSLAKDEPSLKITHRLRNNNLWEITLAPWALSAMAPNGLAIIPLPPRGEHEANLLPTGRLAIWAYTDMADPRWLWGRQYLGLRQNPSLVKPQKIGVSVPAGWAAYYNKKQLFVKKFTYQEHCRYADFGSCVELFVNGDMLELETLGPLTSLAPGACVEHLEEWWLFHDVPEVKTEADIEREVQSRVNKILHPVS